MQRLNILAALPIIALLSCSLKYGEETNVEDKIPELEFVNSRFTRYEKNRESMELTAELLEQYKGGDSSFAKNAAFTIWDESGNVQTQGSCSLLGIDKANSTYFFFNDINISNPERKLTLKCDALRWDEKTQSLSSPKDSAVFITKDGIEIRGKGLSANGISNSFSFEGEVSGKLESGGEGEE